MQKAQIFFLLLENSYQKKKNVLYNLWKMKKSIIIIICLSFNYIVIIIKKKFLKNGTGGHRSRCLLHAKQALYHLSYYPRQYFY